MTRSMRYGLTRFALANIGLLLFGVFIWSPPVAAQPSGGGDLPDRMEQVIRSYVSNKEFMGSVLVARSNAVVLDKGYGFANLEWDTANSPQSKFRLGSITKQFTAAAILLLEERGKLSVNDPVKKYLPDAPAAWDKITIFHLLTHTSGIPDYTKLFDYRSLKTVATTPENLVARFKDKPINPQPGERWIYSNSGYVLLGYLIEKISGESYQKFLQDNIFTPLNMKDTGYDFGSAILAHRASGYVRDRAPSAEAHFVHAPYIDMSNTFSAGGLYSTTDDLLHWEQKLFGGKLLSPDSLQKMTTPFKGDYAFGLQVRTSYGHKVIEHNGGLEGFNTKLAYYPDDKLTIVVLANLNGPAPDQIAMQLAGVALGQKVVLISERKEIAIDPTVVDLYVGRYQFLPNSVLTITREDDRVFAHLDGQATWRIYAESDRDFFYKAVDAQITFEADGLGRATGLVLHQNGVDQHAKRVE